MEKLLPQSIEAEQSVLGSLLIDPDALPEVVEILKPSDFYREAHRVLFEAMTALFEQHEPVDLITLSDELDRRKKLDMVGGPAEITSLINIAPTSMHVISYAQIVAQKALCRRLIQAAGDIAAVAYDEVPSALEEAERLIFALGQQKQGADFTPIGNVVFQSLEKLEEIKAHPGTITGVSTGFHDLDVVLGGLQRSDLVILAARPRVGKTSLALNLAANAIYQQQRVAFFSLEMSKEQLSLRLLSMHAKINQHQLRSGWFHEEEWEALIVAGSQLAKGALWIDDTGGLSITTLHSKARRLHAQQGIDLVIVDYLQLLHATLDGKRYSNREQEIAAISRELKALAKELQVPVLALAQLSRAVEGRSSKVPLLSDLRESGSIENDADVVMFIHRESLYDPDNESAKNTADVIIAKHRNGPEGVITLGFEASQTRFYTLGYTPSPETK